MIGEITTLNAALIITAIGMGLVFVVIVLLWGFMALLVNLTARIEAAGSKAEPEPEAAEIPAAAPVDDEQRMLKKRAAAVAVAALIPGDMHLLKQRAAAAAVSAAIAFKKQAANPASPAASISQWQATGRASILNARSNLFSRKNTR